jgi:uncharacterized membrane protein YdbT with pleckstrin-like domain
MPYNPKKLNEGETIKLDMHPHWWYFFEAAATLAGFIVLGIIFLIWGPDDGFFKDASSWILIGGMIIGALWVLGRYMKWISTNFVVTSNRVIFRQGIIAKSGIEIPLERVNNVNFHQGVLERLLGAGDLLIESGGETGQQRFSDIRNPDEVQNLISREMEAYNQRQGAAIHGVAGAAPATDVTVQLERLEGLLQRGTITREEFDLQKAKLLGL